MTPDAALSLARESGLVMLLVAGPLLGAGLLIGLIVSVVQAVTQIQDATLTFIPKLVAVLAVLALLGHWMLGHLLTYSVGLLANLNAYAR
jgi:flagellar biosynthetic protein FliQ